MSPREHLVLCGPPGTKPAPGRGAWQRATTVRLDATPGSGNVRLKVRDITDRMASGLPQVAEDLVELATYVYAADQASERGDLERFDYGGRWRRRFRFEVPVRQPGVWRDLRVADELVRTLSFLSDDDYEFAFVPHPDPTPLPEYLEFAPGGAPDASGSGVSEVVLFSGGLDSLAGAVEEVLVQRRKVTLVSHRPVSKVESRQNALREQLAKRAAAAAGSARSAPFHVPVLANKKASLGKDFTQRTRSFLFASFAAVVARVFGLDRVRFYENGVVSCNLPICAQVLGGRASRTTHPRVLRGFERLLSLLFGRPFAVENPFFWKTRTDVVEALRAAGHADLAGRSVSCAHTWQAPADRPHCGTCSQCVDRRLATLAAGLSDAEDPPGRYRVQLLTGHLEGVLEQTMVERIVGTARELEGLAGPLEFVRRFGEASRLLGQLPGPADEAAVRLFELHRRHARQVTGLLGRELAVRHAGGARRWAELPPTCLLRVLAGRRPAGRNTAAAASSPYVPSKEDWQILEALAAAEHTLVQQDLLERLATRLSRRTLGKRLTTLVRFRLVHYPQGSRKGIALTGEGRALLAARPRRAGPAARAH